MLMKCVDCGKPANSLIFNGERRCWKCLNKFLDEMDDFGKKVTEKNNKIK